MSKPGYVYILTLLFSSKDRLSWGYMFRHLNVRKWHFLQLGLLQVRDFNGTRPTRGEARGFGLSASSGERGVLLVLLEYFSVPSNSRKIVRRFLSTSHWAKSETLKSTQPVRTPTPRAGTRRERESLRSLEPICLSQNGLSHLGFFSLLPSKDEPALQGNFAEQLKEGLGFRVSVYGLGFGETHSSAKSLTLQASKIKSTPKHRGKCL